MKCPKCGLSTLLLFGNNRCQSCFDKTTEGKRALRAIANKKKETSRRIMLAKQQSK